MTIGCVLTFRGGIDNEEDGEIGFFHQGCRCSVRLSDLLFVPEASRVLNVR